MRSHDRRCAKWSALICLRKEKRYKNRGGGIPFFFRMGEDCFIFSGLESEGPTPWESREV